MRLKKLGAALFVVAALSAALAGSAFAEATTTAAKWYTGPTGAGVTELTGTQAVTAEASGTATFQFGIGGSEAEVKATGIECVGCTISNSAAGGGGTGKLKFTGVTVVKPACTTSATIETEPLTFAADYMEGTSAMVKFTPTAGAGTAFAKFTLVGTGCSLVKIIGYTFGKAVNATGVMATSQSVGFSNAIDSAAGGTLRVGTETATFTATAIFKAGGLFFGVK